jgi:GNAT superfamily N-acetyltransferase
MTAQSVEATVTILEMTRAPGRQVPPPGNMRLALLQAVRPSLHFYRYLYNTVGGAYCWVDRKYLDDETLAGLIHRDEVEVFVAYREGNPAGFFELNRASPREVWLTYFGLMPDQYGFGLGKWMLSAAIDRAWATEPDRICVETCTLDHPRALPLYQKLGFTPFAQKHKVVQLAVDQG